MSLVSSYRSALRAPGVARVVAAVLLCYLLTGMINLSLLLSAEHATGSYAIGGAVMGAYSIAVAVGAPVWGRVVDRRGPRWTLALASLAQTVAFTGYVTAAAIDSARQYLVASAVVAGACSPPSSAVAKKVFAGTPDLNARRALFAISGLLAEVVFVLDPLAVGGLSAVAAPLAGVIAAAVVSVIGVRWLRAASAVRAIDRRGQREVPDQSSHRHSDWNARQFHVLGVVVLGAVAIGALQVSIVAHADDLAANPGPFMGCW